MPILFDPTPATLAMIAGAALSLLFSYFPGLNTWFATLSPATKRLVMAGMMLAVAGAVFGLGCAGIVSGVACSRDGILQLVMIYILALSANQSAYAVSPALPDVTETKAIKAGKTNLGVGKG